MINATHPFTFFKSNIVVIISSLSLSNILSIRTFIPMPSTLPKIVPKSMHLTILKFPSIIRSVSKHHFTFTIYQIYFFMPTYLSFIRITILELYFDLVYIFLSQSVIILPLRQECDERFVIFDEQLHFGIDNW